MSYLHKTMPAWEDSYKILTNSHLNIPNLSMVGYANYRSASNKLDMHYHDTMEVTIILSGTQQYYVDDTIYSLQSGDIFMTKPFERHGNQDDYQNICEYFWFQIDLSHENDNFLGLFPVYGKLLFQQMKQYQTRIKKVNKQDLSHLKDIFFAFASSNPKDQLFAYSHFLSFLTSSVCDIIPDPEHHYSYNIQLAIDFMHSNIKENLNIDAIAEYVRLSRTHFLIKFKNEVGITPHSYFVSMKINAAKQLLKNTNMSSTEIAYTFNFSSSNHFATVFKKQTGYSPSEYRKKHLSKTT